MCLDAAPLPLLLMTMMVIVMVMVMVVGKDGAGSDAAAVICVDTLPAVLVLVLVMPLICVLPPIDAAADDDAVPRGCSEGCRAGAAATATDNGVWESMQPLKHQSRRPIRNRPQATLRTRASCLCLPKRCSCNCNVGFTRSRPFYPFVCLF